MADTKVGILLTVDDKLVRPAVERSRRLIESLGGSFREVASNSVGLEAAFTRLAAAAGAAFSIAGITQYVAGVIQSIDAMNDLADATGASIEQISRLDSVARRNGGTFEDVSTALLKFNKALGDEAGESSKAARALSALGLSFTELQALEPGEALQRTAVALSGFADDAAKARITQELFGKSLREVAPLLKDLVENGVAVGSVTKEQAAQAERAAKSFFLFRSEVQNLGRAFAADLMPAVEAYFDRLNGLVTGRQAQQSRAQSLSLGLATEVSRLESLTKALESPRLNARERSSLERRLIETRGRVEELTRAAAQANEELKATIAGKSLPPAASSDSGAADDRPTVGGLADDPKKVAEAQRALAVASARETARAVAQAVQESSSVLDRALVAGTSTLEDELGRRDALQELQHRAQLVRIDAEIKAERSRKVEGADDAIRQRIALLELQGQRSAELGRRQVESAQLVQAAERARFDAADAAYARLAQSQQAALRTANDLTNQTLVGRLQLRGAPGDDERERTRQKVQALRETAATLERELRLKASLTLDVAEAQKVEEQILELRRATNDAIVLENDILTDRLKPGFQRLLDGWADTTRDMLSRFDEFQSGFIARGRDAFEDFLATGRLSTRTLTGFIRSEFARLIYERYLAQSVASLGNALFGAVLGGLTGSAKTGGSGVSYGFEGMKMKFAGGGYTGDSPRSGGLDGQGGFLAMLHPRETVVDHHKGQQIGGSSVVVNQTINVAAGASRAEVVDAMQRAKVEAVAAVADAVRRGSPLFVR